MIPVPYILLYSYLRSIYYFRMRINLTSPYDQRFISRHFNGDMRRSQIGQVNNISVLPLMHAEVMLVLLLESLFQDASRIPSDSLLQGEMLEPVYPSFVVWCRFPGFDLTECVYRRGYCGTGTGRHERSHQSPKDFQLFFPRALCLLPSSTRSPELGPYAGCTLRARNR